MFVIPSHSLRILVVDDSRAPREAVCGMLHSFGHTTLQASTAQEGVDSFLCDRPDLILLDVEMPGQDGYWAARQIRAREAGHWTPIVFLSGMTDERAVWSGIQAGGDDYIFKPVSALVLLAKIHAVLRQTRMRERLETLSTQLQEANSVLQQLVTVDALTGLTNRRGFDTQLLQEIDACHRERKPLTLLLCDVDHFKRYNDALGHPEGDRCLALVAHTLRQVCRRPRDGAFRYGGEEFALLLPDTPRSGALTFARAVLKQLETVAIEHPDSPVSGLVTLSGGLTTCIPDEDTSAQSLLVRADEALYTAKSSGRNQIFSFEMQLVS
jgi:diguanylate cyclase (GGDEF)-like protein